MKKLSVLFALYVLIIWGCSKEPFSIPDLDGFNKNVAYSVSGNLSDIATGEPIPNTDITVKIFDGVIADVVRKTTQTNSTGDFHLGFFDHRDFLIYWAQLEVGETPGKNYQTALTVNGKEACQGYFSISPTGNYVIRLQPYTFYHLQLSEIPSAWEKATLSVQIGELNPTCSDTLVVEKRVIHLNNPLEMNVLKNIRRIERGNYLIVNYSINLDNVVKFSKQFYPDCPYGDTTRVNLTLN